VTGAAGAAGVALRAGVDPDDTEDIAEFVLNPPDDVLVDVDGVAADLEEEISVLGLGDGRVAKLLPRDRDQVLRLMIGRYSEGVVALFENPTVMVRW
jgi:hypothetical protein